MSNDVDSVGSRPSHAATSAASGTSGTASTTAAQPTGISQPAATAGATAAPPGRELWDPARGPQARDVAQGNTGNCWLMSEMASLAAQSPDTVRNMIHEDADGRGATVTLHNQDGSPAPEHVSLPQNGRGTNAPGVYQSASDALQPTGSDGNHHTWASYFEAAVGQYISQHTGSDPNAVPTIDGLAGGNPIYASRLLTGHEGSETLLTPTQSYTGQRPSADELSTAWNALTSASSGPLTAVSRAPEPGSAVMPNGVERGHYFSVLGTQTDADGSRHVLVRDPKGERSGPTPYDVAGQGAVKRMSLEEFVRTFGAVQG